MTIESTHFFEPKPGPATLPLPERDRGILGEIHSKKEGSGHKIVDYTDPEIRRKAVEARKRAIPKRIFGEAIQQKCEECTGINPAVTGCGGSELSDGSACRLYHVNTREKRFKVTKTAIRKAIHRECKYCVGEENPLSDCSSPHCPLYPHGAGPAVAKREGEAINRLR